MGLDTQNARFYYFYFIWFSAGLHRPPQRALGFKSRFLRPWKRVSLLSLIQRSCCDSGFFLGNLVFPSWKVSEFLFIRKFSGILLDISTDQCLKNFILLGIW